MSGRAGTKGNWPMRALLMSWQPMQIDRRKCWSPAADEPPMRSIELDQRQGERTSERADGRAAPTKAGRRLAVAAIIIID